MKFKENDLENYVLIRFFISLIRVFYFLFFLLFVHGVSFHPRSDQHWSIYNGRI